MDSDKNKTPTIVVWVWREGGWHKIILTNVRGEEGEDDVDELMTQEQFFQMARNNTKKTVN